MTSRWKNNLKSSLQRLKTYIEETKQVLEDDDIPELKLKTRIKILAGYVKRTEDIYGRLEQEPSTGEEIDCGKEVDAEQDFIGTMMDYEEVMANLEVRLESLMISKSKTNELKESFTLPNSYIPNQSVRLPKLVIPTFNGDILRWQEFWDSFESSIHNNPALSKVDKFNYLVSQLGGEAKCCIARLPLTELNYDIAINLLKERFANKKLIINSHYSALMEMPPIKSHDTTKLRRVFDMIEKHMRCLQSLGEDTSSNYFMSLIINKLPYEIVLKIEEMSIKDEMDVKSLITFINDIISARERSEKLTSINSQSNYCNFKNLPPSSHSNHSNEGKWSTSQALVGNSDLLCIFCNGKHWSDQCSMYKTVDERKNKIKGMCFICLKKGHSVKQCNINKRCVYCRQNNNHHRSLCPKQFSSNPSSNKYSAFEKQKSQTTISDKTLPIYNINSSNSRQGNSNMLATKSINPPEERALVSVNEQVILQTATVSLYNIKTNQIVSCGVLLDTGSQRSYITKTLASKLRLKGKDNQMLSLFTFGNHESKTIESQVVDVGIQLKDNEVLVIQANIVPHITGKITSSKTLDIEKIMSSFPNLKLAKGQIVTTHIDLLIGNDFYFDLVSGDKIQISPGLYLVDTKLGWIVSGRDGTQGLQSQTYESSFLSIVQPNNLFLKSPKFETPDAQICKEDGVKNLWQLESIGIRDDPFIKDDDIALSNFNKTVKLEDGRYSVTWPWKDYPPNLPSNYNLALGRLKTLINRLSSKPDLLSEYNSVIKNQLEAGVIECVSGDKESRNVVHYIPHHSVTSISNNSTKLRIVYDASAKTKRTNNSLNDCLYRGPVLLENMSGLLLRFRMNAIGITADIEKAFLQINLQTPDRDVTRFLWLKDPLSAATMDNIEEYRFCRVPFGVISSPFLLSATITYHLSQNNHHHLIAKLKSSFYVDNMVTGCDTEQDAVSLYEIASNLFSDINMNLRYWCSNSINLMSQIPKERTTTENDTNINLLGMRWNAKLDDLHIKPVKYDAELPVSKRQVLSTVSSVFDPLGLISPTTLKAKLFLKLLWEENLNWDELLEERKCKEWNDILTDLLNIPQISIPRYIGLKLGIAELHCFTDASKDVYSCAVYIHLEFEGVVKTNLLFSKSHLTPKSKKSITLPRLELLGVLIGTRALNFVEISLEVKITKRILWTDSQCVLHWLFSSKILPKFIERRITEIKKNSNTQFKYVPSQENPADMATRGKSVDELKHCKEWWLGPQWLSLKEEMWPNWSINSNKIQEEEEESVQNGEETITLTTESGKMNEKPPYGIDINRFSSLRKLLWTTVYCKRFINRCKKCILTKIIAPTAEEIEEARIEWEKSIQEKNFSETLKNLIEGRRDKLQTQLGLFIDENGLIRCKGRLLKADIDNGCKFPKLLPKNDSFTHLIITAYHCKLYHVGVQHTLSELRKEYWIIHGRAVVYKVLRKCLVCIKHEGGPYRLPQMPPLPSERVTENLPFSYTGLDYFGPLYVKSFSKPGEVSKAYGRIFTCLATRAEKN